ncbi:MAG TPA: ABC transporter permease [Trebonia sp.]|jgi:lipooligosaccharide transport system permease protein|nr:ABC transporter permease [Trebonia sp.]
MTARTLSAAQPRPAPGRLAAVPGEWEMTVRALRCWLVVYRRIWRSSIWSSFLGPLFYLGAMGYGLGSLVDAHGTAALGGVPYLQFVAPSILATQAMQTALSESTFPVYGSVKWNKIYIAAQATPLRPADIYRGHLLFNTIRIAMNSAVYLIVMWAFGAARSPWIILGLPAAVLLGVAFAAPVAAWAVTVQVETPFNYVFRFGMVPLMLFSATFFPLSRLPGWLQPVAYATPLWHGVALCRGLSLGTLTLGAAAIHVGYLAALAALGIWAGGRTYRRRLYV